MGYIEICRVQSYQKVGGLFLGRSYNTDYTGLGSIAEEPRVLGNCIRVVYEECSHMVRI